MPWTLRIVHIDLESSGDATLVIAHDTTSGVIRTALVDGGRAGNVGKVHNTILAQAVNPLNVMVVTHYDDDHMGGMTALLNNPNLIYANPRIYDQGVQGTYSNRGKRKSGVPSTPEFMNQDQSYNFYVAAIGSRGVRTRVSGQVISNEDPGGAATLPPNWSTCEMLVGKEILWDGVPGGIPLNAPKMTCIAANQYLYQGPGTTPQKVDSSALTADRNKNAKSLAFLLQFNNFKYYVGGDIEATQEDGSSWDNTQNKYTFKQSMRNKSLMNILNPANNLAGRVHCMKTSHHGSKYSSSPAFITRLNPQAAFISCGFDNQHGHPDQEVVNALQNNNTPYFLTGEALNGPTNLGNLAEVAGVWQPGTPTATANGNILISVNLAQSNNAPVNFNVQFNQPNAGTNIAKNPAFAYIPWGVRNVPF